MLTPRRHIYIYIYIHTHIHIHIRVTAIIINLFFFWGGANPRNLFLIFSEEALQPDPYGPQMFFRIPRLEAARVAPATPLHGATQGVQGESHQSGELAHPDARAASNARKRAKKTVSGLFLVCPRNPSRTPWRNRAKTQNRLGVFWFSPETHGKPSGFFRGVRFEPQKPKKKPPVFQVNPRNAGETLRFSGFSPETQVGNPRVSGSH